VTSEFLNVRRPKWLWPRDKPPLTLSPRGLIAAASARSPSPRIREARLPIRIGGITAIPSPKRTCQTLRARKGEDPRRSWDKQCNWPAPCLNQPKPGLSKQHKRYNEKKSIHGVRSFGCRSLDVGCRHSHRHRTFRKAWAMIVGALKGVPGRKVRSSNSVLDPEREGIGSPERPLSGQNQHPCDV
jgi:hypothetical protein